MTRIAAAVLIAVAVAPLQGADPEAVEIVRRAFQADEANREARRNYTFHKRVETRKLDKSGAVEETESKTYDVLILDDDDEYERLIALNDQPLPSKQDAKEAEKFEREMRKRASESERKREKRENQRRKREEREREIAAAVVEGFDFRLIGDERTRGVDCWVIDAQPKPDWKPAERRTRFLAKLQGRMWISKTDFGWVQVETETTDDVRFGWFLLKLREGAEIEFEQTKVNDEVWLLENFRLRFDARIGLIKGLRREIAISWSDFRRFSADSRLVAAAPDE